MHQLSATAPTIPLPPLPRQPVSPLLPLQQLEQNLLDRFQHDFPLVPRPFALLAQQLNVTETTVIETLKSLQSGGLISRIGAVFQPNVVGVSTLAALAVAQERLEQVAHLVNRHPEVNHNYAREHHFNLWFVATAADAAQLDTVLRHIEQTCDSGPVLRLPLLEQFHIDLGFKLDFNLGLNFGLNFGLNPGFDASAACTAAMVAPIALTTAEQAFMAALQNGLALAPQPFAQLGWPEADALATLARWRNDGVIKRFGVVVRHHELGFTANAMVVWDLPEAMVSALGHRIAASGRVSLCYRRPRRAPDWPYNLFCMLHGKDRGEVEQRIAAVIALCGLAGHPHAVLFSNRRYKQCGARYVTHG